MRLVWTVIAIIWSASAVAAEGPPCAVCHADVVAGPHAHPLAETGSGPACADCHVGAAAHGADPRSAAALASMVTFGPGAAGPGRGACLACHQDAHPGPDRDAHEQRADQAE